MNKSVKKSAKEEVADFLEGKPFLNSRQAYRAFKTANPTSKVSQGYFYTLFTTFGDKETKASKVIDFIKPEIYGNCSKAYKAYCADTEEGKRVVFAYFLTNWKKELGIVGSAKIKKEKVAKKEKVVKAKQPKITRAVVEVKNLSAKQILAKIAEHDKASKILNFNVKNKARILKEAISFFQTKGFEVIA